MISHKNLTRADIGDVAAYYGDAADDYYAKEGESQVWQGRGAEALRPAHARDRLADSAGQAGCSSVVAPSVISPGTSRVECCTAILRGLAASATGMVSVRTPSL